MNRKEAIGALLLEAEVRAADGQPWGGLIVRAAGLCEDPKVIEIKQALEAGTAEANQKTQELITALWDFLDKGKGGFGGK